MRPLPPMSLSEPRGRIHLSASHRLRRVFVRHGLLRERLRLPYSANLLGGHAKVDFGIAPHFERNVFHTRKVFALDVGASAGFYKTRQNDERFFTLSAYPLFRFTFLRARRADMYFAYSLAGPTYISKIVLDGLDTGRHFTFQDFMGIGWFVGRERNMTIGVKINHYSNGNIFTQNAGVKIPLTFSVGYAL
jgi:hypothetical protein